MAFSLRESLALWRNRATSRKKLHTRAQSDLTAARTTDTHPRQHLVDRRDLRSRQLKEARAMVARRLKQLGGSRPKIVNLELRANRAMQDQPRIVYVTGHYSAGPVDRDDQHCEALVRSFDRQHKAQGWTMLGYAFVISRQGTIFLGRPATKVGAHVLNRNTANVGIMCNGGPGDLPSAAQAASLRWLLANAHTSAMPAAWRVDLRGLPVKGHNDWMSTQCPGRFKRMYMSKGRQR